MTTKRRTATIRVVPILLAAIALIIAPADGRAAEISCAGFWGPAADAAQRMSERYPSGRRPTQNTCHSILLRGTIESGDYEKFAKIISENHPFLTGLYLWSAGGKVEEALKIGRLVRKDLLTTYAPNSLLGGSARWGSLFSPLLLTCEGSDCHCASSCFLIWAGGAERNGTFIGLHRPSTESTRFANMPPSEASPLYRRILKEIGGYLQDMEIPQRYIDAMTDTASNEIKWLTEKEADLIREVPSITEWKASSCGRFTNDERDKLTRLLNANRQDEIKTQSLFKKMASIGQCGNHRISAGRDAIGNVLE